MMFSTTRTAIKSFLLFSLFFGSLTAMAQKKFEVPENYEFNTSADYAKYETAIINAAKWLEDTDLDKELDKRQKVNAFVLKWIAGSPSVTIELTEPIGKLCSKNEELFGVYLSAYSRSVLENKKSSTKFLATKASLQAIVRVYKKGIGITKNREMDKLVKADNDNRLDEFIKDYMNLDANERKDPVT